MYRNYFNTHSLWASPFFLYAVMIALGLLTGWFHIPFLEPLGLVIADIFIRIFKCISLPIIALSIIYTLTHYSTEGMMKSVWRHALLYTFVTTLVAASISCFLYLLIQPSLISNLPLVTGVANSSQFNYFSHISNIIPSTFLSPFIDQQVMGVLLLGIIIGIAVRFIPDKEAREAIKIFFRGAHGLLLVITGWVIAIIPLGLFGFITTTVVEFQKGVNVSGLSSYLLVIILANLVQGFVVLPIWLKYQGVKPFKAMYGMLPALSIAFFSKSSVGTLPVTMETAENNLQVKPEISRFVLPLCTSLNMNGCAAFIFATVIYLMQNHGIVISLPMMLLWIVISTISAIGNAGVPMGCFFLSASLLSSMNIPITLMGLILPFYTIIDMLETSLNVWSDSCVTKVVNDKVERKQF